MGLAYRLATTSVFILPSREMPEISEDVVFCGGHYEQDRGAYVLPDVSADQMSSLCATHGLSWALEPANLT